MSRLSKEELARFSGAEWMLRLVEEKGIEEAKKELENRNLRGIPLKVKNEDVKRFYTGEYNNIVKCLTLISASTLYDEYDFGVEDLNRYINRFNTKASCIADDYVSWKEIQEEIRSETGILIPLPEDRK